MPIVSTNDLNPPFFFFILNFKHFYGKSQPFEKDSGRCSLCTDLINHFLVMQFVAEK